MSGARNLEELKTQALTCIEAAYDKGYKAAKQDIVAVGNKSEYERGLNDAEKARKRLVSAVSNGGLSEYELEQIFDLRDYGDVLTEYTISEIIEKIREYDKQKEAEEASDDEICVGDVVMYMNQKYIVVNLMKYKDNAIIINQKDALIVLKKKLKKTGHNYLVDEILEGIKNEK